MENDQYCNVLCSFTKVQYYEYYINTNICTRAISVHRFIKHFH